MLQQGVVALIAGVNYANVLSVVIGFHLTGQTILGVEVDVEHEK